MSETKAEKPCCNISLTYAHLLLRLWIGLRLFMAGLDKFRAGNGETTTFSLENYTKKSDQIASLMSTNSFLPASMCQSYAHSIGYVLVAVGIWVTLGLFTNLSLLAAGFTLLSLGFGLAALPDDTEVVYIGIQVLIVAVALATARHRQLSLDGLFFRKKNA